MINFPYKSRQEKQGDSPIELAFMIFMVWVVVWLADNVIRAGRF